MKKILLIVSLFILGFSLKAQEDPKHIPYNARFMGYIIVDDSIFVKNLSEDTVSDTIIVINGNKLSYILKSDLFSNDSILWRQLLGNVTLKDTIDSINIGGSIPLSKFHVENGGILATGTTGGVSVDGAGTRFFWAPSKRAFRAGAVTGTEWNSANIGDYSYALGLNCLAPDYSYAFGNGVAINGNDNSFGFGSILTLNGDSVFAIGGNLIGNSDFSFLIGKDFISSTPNSLMIGFNATPTFFVDGTNVGIGTITPGYKLHVEASGGTAGYFYDDDNTVELSNGSYGISSTQSGISLGAAYFTDDASNTVTLCDASNAAIFVDGNANQANLCTGGIAVEGVLASGTEAGSFSDGTTTVKLSNGTYPILTTGGNVGIGSATPSSQLDVDGDVRLIRTIWDNTDAIEFDTIIILDSSDVKTANSIEILLLDSSDVGFTTFMYEIISASAFYNYDTKPYSTNRSSYVGTLGNNTYQLTSGNFFTAVNDTVSQATIAGTAIFAPNSSIYFKLLTGDMAGFGGSPVHVAIHGIIRKFE